MSQSRATPNGSWSQIGSDEQVTSDGRGVGAKKTLVFYIRDSQERIKTNWVMHEFHLLEGSHSNTSSGSANNRTKRGHSTTKVIEYISFFKLFNQFNIYMNEMSHFYILWTIHSYLFEHCHELPHSN